MIGIGELAGKLEEVLNALTGYYKGRKHPKQY